jgi:hypothetical protein
MQWELLNYRGNGQFAEVEIMARLKNFVSATLVSGGLGAVTNSGAEAAELFAATALLGAAGSSLAGETALNMCRAVSTAMAEITTDFSRERGCARCFTRAANL